MKERFGSIYLTYFRGPGKENKRKAVFYLLYGVNEAREVSEALMLTEILETP